MYAGMQVCKYVSMQECYLLLAICDLLSVTCYMLLANWIFLSETCYDLQNLFPFARCCTSRNFYSTPENILKMVNFGKTQQKILCHHLKNSAYAFHFYFNSFFFYSCILFYWFNMISIIKDVFEKFNGSL